MLGTRYFVAALAAMLSATAAAPAKDGRDFAGFYSLTNATRQADQVRVTVTMQLFNYSGADLTQASVIVRETSPGDRVLGSYAPIELWHNGADLKVAMHILVPLQEYARWGGRLQPAVLVINHDDQGREWQRTVQVSRRATISLADNSASQ